MSPTWPAWPACSLPAGMEGLTRPSPRAASVRGHEVGMPIGSIASRLSNLNPFSKASAKPGGSTSGSPSTCRPEHSPNGGKNQGGTPPKDMHDSQPDPTSRKMTLGDKVSQGANLVGAAATIYPMLKGSPK